MRFWSPLLFLAAATLAAQEPSPIMHVREASNQGWSYEVGARYMDYPSYLGSDRQRSILLPIFAAEYDRRFYLGPTLVGMGFGGGIHLLREGNFTWDAALGIGDRRPESRSPLLAGMGDRRSDLFAGTGFHYRHQGFHAGLTFSHGLRDDSGNRGTLTLGQTLPVASSWFFTFGLHETWVDAQAMNYDFGVSPEQAATRAALVAAGDPRLSATNAGPFTPRAGLRDLGCDLTLSYRPDSRWTWSAGFNGGVLQGGVRNSPLVGRNAFGGLNAGFTYHF